MADIFCDNSSGSDANSGLTRALAKATLNAAFTAAGAGGRVGLKSTHVDASLVATGTIASPGTAAAPCQVLSIDWSSDTFDSNAISAGAIVRLQATANNQEMTFSGHADCEGVTIQSAQFGGSGGNLIIFTGTTTSTFWTFRNGLIELRLNTSSPRLQVGSTPAVTNINCGLRLINTPISFANASQGIVVNNGNFDWEATPTNGVQGTVPTALVLASSATGHIVIDGVDLSAVSGTLFANLASTLHSLIMARNCKLHASVTLTSGTIGSPNGVECHIINCASDDTNYRYHKQFYAGTITHEATIVRSGGASDGTTPISRKMVTLASGPSRTAPLVSDPIVVWNETTGSSLTATIEVVTDGVTLTDKEAWVDVFYLGTSGVPLASKASDAAATLLTAAANQTSSSETWTTTGLGSPVKQKLSVSFTPQEKGPILIRVKLAKASTTMYFCPKATIA